MCGKSVWICNIKSEGMYIYNFEVLQKTLCLKCCAYEPERALLVKVAYPTFANFCLFQKLSKFSRHPNLHNSQLCLLSISASLCEATMSPESRVLSEERSRPILSSEGSVCCNAPRSLISHRVRASYVTVVLLLSVTYVCLQCFARNLVKKCCNCNFLNTDNK